MYVSIDLVEEIIERQLKKYKNKLIDKKQSRESFSDNYIEKDYEEDDNIKIIRTKKFGIKPMARGIQYYDTNGEDTSYVLCKHNNDIRSTLHIY